MGSATQYHFTLGLVMGLAIGEGSFTGDHRTPSFAIRSDETTQLEHARQLFGGTVYGPYRSQHGTHFWVYRLRGSELFEALPLFEKWLPSGVKRRQFDAWHTRWQQHWRTMEPRWEHLGKIDPLDDLDEAA